MKNKKEEVVKYRVARLHPLFENIKVVEKSEEKIDDEIFVQCIINGRTTKMKKSSLEFV